MSERLALNQAMAGLAQFFLKQGKNDSEDMKELFQDLTDSKKMEKNLGKRKRC